MLIPFRASSASLIRSVWTTGAAGPTGSAMIKTVDVARGEPSTTRATKPELYLQPVAQLETDAVMSVFLLIGSLMTELDHISDYKRLDDLRLTDV